MSSRVPEWANVYHTSHKLTAIFDTRPPPVGCPRLAWLAGPSFGRATKPVKGLLQSASRNVSQMPQQELVPSTLEPLRMTRLPIALVVNKEDWLARSIEAVLVEHGYVVQRSGSAGEALEFLATGRPDAVVLDRQLPDADGATLCRRLRDDFRVGPSVPIAVTSMVSLSAGERAEFFRAGAWDLWGPLLEPEVFATKLDTFVSARLSGELRVSDDVNHTIGLLSGHGLAQKAREVGAVVNRLGAPLACIAIAPAKRDQPGAHFATAGTLFRDIARLWPKHGRSADGVGRLSEDTLGVVAPGSDSAGAVALVRRLQVLLDAQPTTGEHETELPIRAGYCAAMNLAESLSSVPEMLERAATAVRYAAGLRGADIVSYDDIPPEARR